MPEELDVGIGGKTGGFESISGVTVAVDGLCSVFCFFASGPSSSSSLRASSPFCTESRPGLAFGILRIRRLR